MSEHYKKSPSGVECMDVVQHMTFCQGNAMKYIWRAGLKPYPGKTAQESACIDYQKAIDNLNQEIDRLRC